MATGTQQQCHTSTAVPAALIAVTDGIVLALHGRNQTREKRSSLVGFSGFPVVPKTAC